MIHGPGPMPPFLPGPMAETLINFNAPVVINIYNEDGCGEGCSGESADSEPECPDEDPGVEEIDDILEEI